MLFLFSIREHQNLSLNGGLTEDNRAYPWDRAKQAQKWTPSDDVAQRISEMRVLGNGQDHTEEVEDAATEQSRWRQAVVPRCSSRQELRVCM